MIAFRECFSTNPSSSPLLGKVDIYTKKKELAGYEMNPFGVHVARFIREWHWT